MAFSEFETARFEKLIQEHLDTRRPPEHQRDQIDLGFRIENHSFELFEIRPRWDNPSEILHPPIAKATFVKTRNIWKIFWQRGDMKWHAYKPQSEVATIEQVLEVIDNDDHGCFYG